MTLTWLELYLWSALAFAVAFTVIAHARGLGWRLYFKRLWRVAFGWPALLICGVGLVLSAACEVTES